jgi:hypothetical protein
MADYENLLPQGSTPLGLRAQAVQDIFDRFFPRLVNAENEAMLKQLFDQMHDEMETAGLSEVEEAINENFQVRLELWELEIEN